MTEAHLIERCRQFDAKAQKMLYDQFAPKMLGVCRRYVHNRDDAEDVLIESMYKVFEKIDSFKSEGSFEGWIRRIVVNELLMFLRKKRLLTIDLDVSDVAVQNLERLPWSENREIDSDFAVADIMRALDTLPNGYKTVFNLYVLDGFKHAEIAEMLNISVNTSKSQLILAKKRLQSELEKIK
jgi:RNA polymerase sigma factor (sigma-70 family)